MTDLNFDPKSAAERIRQFILDRMPRNRYAEFDLPNGLAVEGSDDGQDWRTLDLEPVNPVFGDVYGYRRVRVLNPPLYLRTVACPLDREHPQEGGAE